MIAISKRLAFVKLLRKSRIHPSHLRKAQRVTNMPTQQFPCSPSTQRNQRRSQRGAEGAQASS